MSTAEYDKKLEKILTKQKMDKIKSSMANWDSKSILEMIKNEKEELKKEIIVNYVLANRYSFPDKKDPDYDLTWDDEINIYNSLRGKFVVDILEKAPRGTLWDEIALDIYQQEMNTNLPNNYNELEESEIDLCFQEAICKMNDKTIKALLLAASDKIKEKVFSNLLHIYSIVFESYSKSNLEDLILKCTDILPKEILKITIEPSNYNHDRLLVVSDRYKNLGEAIDEVRDSIPEEQLPDMSEYDEKIKNGELLNKASMEDFLQKVAQIREKTWVIDEKYCDYAIKNAIMHGKDEGYIYSEPIRKLLPFIILDKTYHILQEEDINYVAPIVSNSKISECGNYHPISGHLELSKVHMIAIAEGENNVINTMFHEIQHAKQYDHINNKNLQNKYEYDIIKERLLQENDSSFLTSSKFYKSNYKILSMELEARIIGRQKMYSYLQSLGIPIEKILEGDSEYNHEKYQEYESFLNENVQVLEDNKRIYEGNDTNTTLDVLFQNLIVKDPLIMYKYPILKHEFKIDGNRKSALEILEEYEKEMEEMDYIEPAFDLYEYLISADISDNPDLEYDIMLRDAKLLLEYAPRTLKGKEIKEQVAKRIKDYSNKNIESEQYNSKEIDTLLQEYENAQSSNKANITLNMIEYIDSEITGIQREQALKAIKQELNYLDKENDEEITR